MLLQEDGIIILIVYFFFQAEDGIRDDLVTGVQTCALPIYGGGVCPARRVSRPRGPRYKRESISEQDKLHLHDRLAGARVELGDERLVAGRGHADVEVERPAGVAAREVRLVAVVPRAVRALGPTVLGVVVAARVGRPPLELGSGQRSAALRRRDSPRDDEPATGDRALRGVRLVKRTEHVGTRRWARGLGRGARAERREQEERRGSQDAGHAPMLSFRPHTRMSEPGRRERVDVADLAAAIERLAADLALAEEPSGFTVVLESDPDMREQRD